MENRSNDLLVGSFVLIFVIAALGFVGWLTGRDVGGEAVALVEIDGALPAGVLDEIKSLPQVVRADILQFSAQG